MAAELQIECAEELIALSGGVLRYGRVQLLDLQDACENFQDEWWTRLLASLGPDVAEELQELQALSDVRHFRRRSKNSERRQRSKAKREALHAISTNAPESVEDGPEIDERGNFHDGVSYSNFRKGHENSGGRIHSRKGTRRRRDHYDNDEEEIESFQPRAFQVTGEPDFESGPPQDGWEYLRRVIYEAASCPKVVVATIDATKLTSEQTQYVPEMPEIPHCPPDLPMSKERETQFLSDFSLLRMALSNICVPPFSASERIPPVRNNPSWEVRCFGSASSTQQDDCVEVHTGQTADGLPECREELVTIPSISPQLSTGPLQPEGNCPKTEEAPIEIVDGIGSDVQYTSCSTEVTEFKMLASVLPEESTPSNECMSPRDIEKDENHSCPKLMKTDSDQNFVAESVDTNYVITLSLLKPWKASQGLEDLCNTFQNDSDFLICGELTHSPDEVDGRDSQSVFPPVSQLEDTEVFSSKEPGTLDDVTVQPGDVDSIRTFETQFDRLTMRDPEVEHNDQISIGNCNHSHNDTSQAFQNVELKELETSREVELDRLMIESADVYNLENLSPLFEAFEDHHLTDFTDLIPGSEESPDYSRFEDDGLDYPLDSLNIPDLDVINDEFGIMIPSPSYPDLSDVIDVETELLTATDFEDSFVGLEVFNLGETRCDRSSSQHKGVFKLDENVEKLFDKVFQLVGIAQLPFIHLLLSMDEVSRAALFRFHVSWLENFSGLPQDRALWLLALSAVVDVPLSAETSAAFRALLRHCAQLRSLKQRGDEEDLYMLNALIAIAGVYFGQAEKESS